MTNIIKVITPWVGDGTSMANAFHPKIHDDYPAIISWQNVNRTPASVGGTVELQVACDDITLSAIRENSNYSIIEDNAVSNSLQTT